MGLTAPELVTALSQITEQFIPDHWIINYYAVLQNNKILVKFPDCQQLL